MNPTTAELSAFLKTRRQSRRGLLAAAGCALLPRWAKADPLPDVGVIVLDDMRTEDWAILAKTQARLPGTMYDNYIMTTPICGPSRACMFTGQYASHHGVHTNQHAYQKFKPLASQTLPAVLKANGVRTGIIGKYMNGYTGAPEAIWEVNQAVKNPTYHMKGGYSTTIFGDATVQFLQTSTTAPNFFWVGFKAPHLPATPDVSYKGTDHSSWTPLGGDPQNLTGKATYLRKDGPWGSDDTRHATTLDQHRRETIMSVDAQIERIVQAQTRPCLWIVCSDNGFLLGEQNRSGKNVPYDPALRCPLLLSGPGIGQGRDPTLIGNIDLLPTVLEYLGLSFSFPIDGRPFHQGHDALLIQGWRKDGEGAGGKMPNTHIPNPAWVGYRDADTMYVEYASGETERYDHRNDPFEQHDLGPDASSAARLRQLQDPNQFRPGAGHQHSGHATGSQVHQATNGRRRPTV